MNAGCQRAAKVAATASIRSRGETGDAAAQQDEPSSDQIGGTQDA